MKLWLSNSVPPYLLITDYNGRCEWWHTTEWSRRRCYSSETEEEVKNYDYVYKIGIIEFIDFYTNKMNYEDLDLLKNVLPDFLRRFKDGS